MNKGKIFVVGIGPGDRRQMTPAALDAIRQSTVIVGYKTYIMLIEDLLDGKIVKKSGMGDEIERCEEVLRYAESGDIVSLVSSGDPGVYGMAGLMLQVCEKEKSDIPVEIIPGITSANAAAASLGAPLMHDYAVISLSDLLTDWELIEKRLRCAGEADFVVCLYNPKSHGRQEQIERAREILLEYKSGNTPVGIVRKAMRENEEIEITTLEKMLEHKIDMLTTVIIGNSQTYILEARGERQEARALIITPRGYKGL